MNHFEDSFYTQDLMGIPIFTFEIGEDVFDDDDIVSTFEGVKFLIPELQKFDGCTIGLRQNWLIDILTVEELAKIEVDDWYETKWISGINLCEYPTFIARLLDEGRMLQGSIGLLS